MCSKLKAHRSEGAATAALPDLSVLVRCPEFWDAFVARWGDDPRFAAARLRAGMAKPPLEPWALLRVGSSRRMMAAADGGAVVAAPPVGGPYSSPYSGLDFVNCNDPGPRQALGALVVGRSGSGTTHPMARRAAGMLRYSLDMVKACAGSETTITPLTITCTLGQLLPKQRPAAAGAPDAVRSLLAALRAEIGALLGKFRLPGEAHARGAAVLLVIDEVGVAPGFLAEDETWRDIVRTVGVGVKDAWPDVTTPYAAVVARGTFGEAQVTRRGSALLKSLSDNDEMLTWLAGKHLLAPRIRVAPRR